MTAKQFIFLKYWITAILLLVSLGYILNSCTPEPVPTKEAVEQKAELRPACWGVNGFPIYIVDGITYYDDGHWWVILCECETYEFCLFDE